MLEPNTGVIQESESVTGTLSNSGAANNRKYRYITSKKINQISNFLSPSFNIINTTLGSGVLNLGYGVKLMGIPQSSILLIFTFILTSWSFYVYARIGSLIYSIESKNKENTEKLEEKTDSSFNITLRMIFSNLFPSVWYLMDLIIVINCFLGCVGYLITIGGSVNDSIVDDIMTVNSPWLKRVVKKSLILIPLSLIQFLIAFLESLDSLKPVSILGFFANLYIIGLNCYTVSKRSSSISSTVTSVVSDSMGSNNAKSTFFKICQIMEYIGIFTVCFNCHYASIPLFSNFIQQYKKENPKRSNNEVVKKSKNVFKMITLFSYICIFIVNSSIAITSYLAFGEEIKTDIQGNYGTSVSAILLKLSISISVFCCFPIVLRSFGISFTNLFPQLKEKMRLVSGISIALICSAAILITSLSDVNAFRGALSGSIILYLTPGLMILKLRKHLNMPITISGMILSVYGTFCLIAGLVSILVVKIFNR